MSAPLAFLHTAQAHVATFDALVAELDPTVAASHLVDPTLLADARAAGGATSIVASRVAGAMRTLADEGARVVVCTCSTVGAAAEVDLGPGRHALRIDRPMAEAAVAAGRRIAIVAALASTFAPTRALLEDEARRAARRVELRDVLCAGAWPLFEAGDRAGYRDRVAAAAREAGAACDVVVLAQASMAEAAALCADAGTKVLASPRLGVVAALRALRAGGERDGHAGSATPPR
ncbi:MAG TPA: hypothetical protein VMW35_04945 [Myxococcota bacterium]|nr:hypothetical protein [Myxococcota bacterium]